jgi:hypothetical protein
LTDKLKTDDRQLIAGERVRECVELFVCALIFVFGRSNFLVLVGTPCRMGEMEAAGLLGLALEGVGRA